MSRFDKASKVIRCNLSDLDLSKAEFQAIYSPNNVKRVIIGMDAIMINFHVTGNRYRSNTSVIQVNLMDIKEDYLNGEVTSKNNILRILVEPRVCSCVEEIIFCSKNYPPSILNAEINTLFEAIGDVRLSGAEKREKLRSRFVRLDNISVYPETCISFVNKIKEEAAKSRQNTHDILFKDYYMDAPGYRIDFSDQGEWWESTYLRPKEYYFDLPDGMLAKRLQKVKEDHLKIVKANKLEEIEDARINEIVEKYAPRFDKLCDLIMKIWNEFRQNTDAIQGCFKGEFGTGLQKTLLKALNVAIPHDDAYDRLNLEYLTRAFSKVDSFQSFINDFYSKGISGAALISASTKTKWNLPLATDNKSKDTNWDNQCATLQNLLIHMIRGFYFLMFYGVFHYVSTDIDESSVLRSIIEGNYKFIENVKLSKGITELYYFESLKDYMKAMGVKHCDYVNTYFKNGDFVTVINGNDLTVPYMASTAIGILHIVRSLGE